MLCARGLASARHGIRPVQTERRDERISEGMLAMPIAQLPGRPTSRRFKPSQLSKSAAARPRTSPPAATPAALAPTNTLRSYRR